MALGMFICKEQLLRGKVQDTVIFDELSHTNV